MISRPGSEIQLSAKETSDPDGDKLTYHCWHYKEASNYQGTIEISNANTRDASFLIPEDVTNGTTIHIICEVKDNGSPQLTRYKRVVVTAHNDN